MDPLIGNGIDPALLRVLDKRGQERDRELRRKRPAPEPAIKKEKDDEDIDEKTEGDSPKHEIDNLA